MQKNKIPIYIYIYIGTLEPNSASNFKVAKEDKDTVECFSNY